MNQDQDKSKSVIEEIESSVNPSVATAEDISDLIDELSDDDLALFDTNDLKYYGITDEDIDFAIESVLGDLDA